MNCRTHRLTAEPFEDRLAPVAGTLDATFGTAGIVSFPQGTVGPVAAVPDGRILAAVPGGIGRFFADGSPDTTFGTNGIAPFATQVLTALPDGGALIGGITGNVDQSEQFTVIRLTAAGTPDPNFGTGGTAIVGPVNSLYTLAALVVQPDGRILVVGGQEQDTIEGITGGQMFVARLTTTGQPDPSFDQDGIAIIFYPMGEANDARATSAAVQPDGKIILGGRADTTGPGGAEPVAVRLTASGQLDPSFGFGGRVTVLFPQSQNPLTNLTGGFVATQVFADGRVLLAGRVSTSAGDVGAAARLTSSGQLDPTFGSGGMAETAPYLTDANSQPNLSAAIDTLGRVVFSTVNVTNHGQFFVNPQAFRLTSDGFADAQFGTGGRVDLHRLPGLTSSPSNLNLQSGLAVQGDGNILLGGFRDGATGGFEGLLVRLIGDGPPDGFVATGAGMIAASGANGGLFQALSPTAGTYAIAGTLTNAPATAGGVRVATADVNGDSIPEYITGGGPGGPPRVIVVDGKTGATLSEYLAFEPSFTGGVFVAAADLDGDNKAEIVVTPDQGGGPRVVVFSIATAGATTQRASFFGIDDPNFRGGARVALGDVNHDGSSDLAVAAGFLGGPRVALFDGKTLFGGNPTRLVNDFFAFPGRDAITLRNGAYVAIGDLNGDGFADLIFGGGPGGAPRIFILSGQTVSSGDVAGSQASPLANFFVKGNSADRGGARVAAVNADGDTQADIVVGSGENDPANVWVYLGKNFTSSDEPASQQISVFGGVVLPGGVYVG